MHALCKYDWDAAFLMYMGQMPLDKIAEVLSIPEENLRHHARKKCWFARRCDAVQKAKFAVDRDLKKKIEDYKNQHLNFMVDSGKEVQKTIEKIDLEEAPAMVVAKLDLLEKHHNIQSKVLKLDEPDKSDPNTMGFHVLIALQKRGGGQPLLVNDNPQEGYASDKVHVNESDDLDPYSRSIPFDDKNHSKPILRVLEGSSDSELDGKTVTLAIESTQNGHIAPTGNPKTDSIANLKADSTGTEKEEKKETLNELAEEFGVSKGTKLPPINWG